jgi:hypothetical protein
MINYPHLHSKKADNSIKSLLLHDLDLCKIDSTNNKQLDVPNARSYHQVKIK